jgi:hypothetical protein
VFDSAETLRKILPKLVRSYAADAVEAAARKRRQPAARQAAAFLAAVGAAEARPFPAVGAGVDLRFDADGLAGGALAVDDSLVHLTAFVIGARKPEGTRIHRRRHHAAPGTAGG